MSKKWMTRTYQIHNDSKIWLIGQTNLNSFTCECTHVFKTQNLTAELPEKGQYSVHFQSTSLIIPINSLDCGNLLMNLNLRRSLNAEKHPNILIEFLKANWKTPEQPWASGDWVEIKALARVTINGNCEEYWLNISGKQNTAGHYRCSCTQSLRMSDFDIVPPTAMMGMVKVRDGIEINLDLEIILE